ncbi:MAG: AAA family ATPase [Syntrophothermus sp.]
MFFNDEFDIEEEELQEKNSIVNNKIVNENGLYKLRLQPVLERFYNDDYGIYLCLDLDTERIEQGALGEDCNAYDKFVITGNMQRLSIGKDYECLAELIYHQVYGEQFHVKSIYCNSDNTKEDECNMLREFVATSIYEQIVKIYEYPVSAVLKGEFDYGLISGMGEVRYKSLYDKVVENQKYVKALSNLGKYGISFLDIKRVVETYGSCELAIEKVQKNPYILYHDIKGIGFLKADMLAQTFGIAKQSVIRIHAGIIYTLELNEYKGNTWANIDMLKLEVENVLGLSIDDNTFVECILDKTFYAKGNVIAMKKLYDCEMNIAIELDRIFKCKTNFQFDDYSKVNDKIESIENELNIKYTQKQQELFYLMLQHNLVVLTGYAGTGKTMCVNGILKMLSEEKLRIMLVSPTAKAAKVLSKSTGIEATTIHRALKWQSGKFQHDKNNQLICDVIVIDESSMIDIYLFRSLIQAIPDGCKVLLIGDTAQLESISVGNVLHDIINSGKYPVISLTHVFRQALVSGILYCATEVRNGSKFYAECDEHRKIGGDCNIWFGKKDDSLNRVLQVYSECIKKWKLDDILVISPMKKGNSGIIMLNKALQAIVNPVGESELYVESNGITFRTGDKVRHTKNDYNAQWLDKKFESIERKFGVYNGDFGIVSCIEYHNNNKNIYVDYGDKIIMYKKPYRYLDLAYAITCHSSQGSQSSVVIGVIDMSHYMNLKRNLVYTMITRAEDRLFIIAEKKALGIAICNNTISKKQTFLQSFINNL